MPGRMLMLIPAELRAGDGPLSDPSALPANCEAPADTAFPSQGNHATKVAPEVDRIQVDVNSKGQAIGRQNSNA